MLDVYPAGFDPFESGQEVITIDPIMAQSLLSILKGLIWTMASWGVTPNWR